MIKDIFILIGKFLIMLLGGFIIFHLGILSVKPKEVIKEIEGIKDINIKILDTDTINALLKEYQTYEHYLQGYGNGYRDGYRDGKANE